MAGGNKKKKKPAANPARGFATTSTVSKSRPDAADTPSSDATAVNSHAGTNTATPEQTTVRGQASTDKERELKDLSPEELEAQLEQSELQQIVDQHATKVHRDASRQISRLETDRRLSRGQAEHLSTRSWFPEERRFVLLETIAQDTTSDCARTSARLSTAMNEIQLITRLWTLKLVLQGLKFAQSQVSQALEYVLSRSDIEESTLSTWGLTESLEWLAFQTSDLPDYEIVKQSATQDTAVIDQTLSQRIEAAAKIDRQQHTSKTTRKAAANVESKAVSGSTTPDINVSDTDSDIEPDEMLAKYVKYKLQLFEHRPQSFEDAQPSSRSNRPGEHNQPTTLGAGEVRLMRRLDAMEKDPLFDSDAAEISWRERHAQAFREQAERRKMGVARKEEGAKTNGIHKKSNRPKGVVISAAESVSAEAEAAAKDLLDEADDEAGLFEGIFDTPSEANGSTLVSQGDGSSTAIMTRTFSKITGPSPRRVLEEACKAKDPGCRITIKMISPTTYHCRHSILVQWSKDQERTSVPPLDGLDIQSTARAVLIEMLSVAASGTDQSEGFACTATLFAIFSGSPKEDKASLRLPQSFRELYQEFVVAKQAQSDKEHREIVKELRITIEKKKAEDEDKDVVLTKAFRDRSKKSSGEATPNGVPKEVVNTDATDLHLQELWTHKSQTAAYQTMLRGRRDLPMYHFKDEALEVVRQNQVTILCGETGCGKSTQMPAFILEDQLSHGQPCRIYCTEPRRISAISLAQRVSEELGEGKNAVGTARSLVGYAIRLESQTVASTRLVYATVGIVLRMLESQDGLKDLTHLVIDEVHERSIDTDFLLIVLQTLMVKRPDLKVVLMSATVDAERFSRYLGNAPVITVPGRTFPVRALYLEDAIEMTGYKSDESMNGRADDGGDDELDTEQKQGPLDTEALSGYSKSTVKTLTSFDEYRIDYVLIMRLLELVAKDVKLRDFSKAVLVFLPGIAEIRQLTDMLTGHPTFSHGWLVYPLHSTFSSDEQQAAFQVPPKGMRKIVLATNIAETGITIPDVTCVIDTGKHKEMRFDERRQLSRLIQSFISRANAKQRRGRAGRVQEGICFHLFTKQRHDKMMNEQQTPEMLRLSLQDLVMRVRICKLGDIEKALSQALDPPSAKNIRRAVDALIEVGALTSAEELTALGQQLAKLPLDAQLGKLIVLGSVFGCLDFALTTAAIASSKSPFLSPMNARRQADTVRLGFKRGDSDLMTAYNAYLTWRKVCASAGISEFEFCKKNFLSSANLANIEELKGQLLSSLSDAGLVSLSAEERSALSRIRHSRHQRSFIAVPPLKTEHEANDTLVCSVVAWSFYPKILVRAGNGWRSVANNQSLSLHPTSVNKLSPSPSFEKVRYLSFYSIMQSSSRFTNAQETSPVEAMALVLLAGDAKFDLYSGVITIDGNRLRYKVNGWKDMLILKHLRSRIREILSKGYRKPGRDLSSSERQWFGVFLDIFRGFEENRKQRDALTKA